MFKFSIGEPGWSSSDNAALRTFLTTPLGQRFLQQLFYQRPEVISKNRDERLTETDKQAGFEDCIKVIMSLARPNVTEEDRAVHNETVARDQKSS